MTKNDKEFESLFKSNYTRLYYYALTFVDDAEVCKDIVSDVFETLWHDYDSVRPDGRMAYLYACVKNRCVDHLRRRSVKQRYVSWNSASSTRSPTGRWLPSSASPRTASNGTSPRH